MQIQVLARKHFFHFLRHLLPPTYTGLSRYPGNALILRIIAISKPFRIRFVNSGISFSFQKFPTCQLLISTNAAPSPNALCFFPDSLRGPTVRREGQIVASRWNSRFDFPRCGCFILGSRQRRSTSNPLVSLKRTKNISCR